MQLFRFRVHQIDDNGTSTNNVDGNKSGAAITAVPIMENGNSAADKEQAVIASVSWRRILLLIIAVTVHNLPEGLAVGVAFGMFFFLLRFLMYIFFYIFASDFLVRSGLHVF